MTSANPPRARRNNAQDVHSVFRASVPRPRPFAPGRLLIHAQNLVYSVGAFYFDFSSTHVYNPLWPPHARFHNGQTMTLALLLAATSSYLAYRSAYAQSTETRRERLGLAVLVGSCYCLAGLSGILYPGAGWGDKGTETGEQGWVFGGCIVMAVCGWLTEIDGKG